MPRRTPMTTISEQLAAFDLQFSPIYDESFHPLDLGYFKGSYRGFIHEVTGGSRKVLFVKNWRTQETHRFVETTGEYKKDHEVSFKALSTTQREKAKKQLEIQQNEARITAQNILHNECVPIKYLTKYQEKKKWPTTFIPNNLYVMIEQPQTLIVPMSDINNDIWSFQTIFVSSDKVFMPKGRYKGLMYTFGHLDMFTENVYVVEGLATGMSAYTATNTTTICAMTAGNIEPVVQELKRVYPYLKIVIAGDNDHTKERNIGREMAIFSAKKHSSDVILPDPKGMEDIKDWNDIHCEMSLDEVRLQLTANIKEDPYADAYKEAFMSIQTNSQGKPVKLRDYDLMTACFNHKHNFLVHSDSQTVYTYTGTHYEPMIKDIVEAYGFHMLREGKKSSRDISEFYTHVKNTRPTTKEWWDETTKGLINLQNGVFDTVTGRFTNGHSKARGFRYCLPYKYDPEATAPMFQKMLHDITCERSDLKTVLLEFIGYCISNDPCYSDKVLVLTGEGSNGKSRFMSVVRGLVGSGALSLGHNDLSNKFMIGMLDKVKYVLFEEMPSFTTKNFWEEIKGLASGKETTADEKFKRPYTFQNKAKLIFTCNKLPSGTDPSHGFFRRLLIVPFEATFKQGTEGFIHNIDEQIVAQELSGVFNMIWEAYGKFRDRNFMFTECQAINEKVAEYKEDHDSVARWCIDAQFGVTDDLGRAVNKQEMFSDYKRWCQETGAYPVSMIEMIRRLVVRYPVLREKHRNFRPRESGIRQNIFLGAFCTFLPPYPEK